MSHTPTRNHGPTPAAICSKTHFSAARSPEALPPCNDLVVQNHLNPFKAFSKHALNPCARGLLNFFNKIVARWKIPLPDVPTIIESL